MSGPLNGLFEFNKLPDGNVDKTTVKCSLCKQEFQYHRSTSSLKYHIQAKHPLTTTASKEQPQLRQTTLWPSQRCDESTKRKVTTAIAKWVAVDCRPLSIVEDVGLREVLKIAFSDSYTVPSRGTITKHIGEIYDTEKAAKMALLRNANKVALTGDYWSSVNNQAYLGVTAHHIDADWKLQSFALTVQHTDERHFAETCAQHFTEVAEQWGVAEKVSTTGTDSARNMVAAARILPYTHMPCIAHSVQRSITIAIRDSGLENILGKCRKIVGHFKHSPANAAELQRQQVEYGQKQEPLIQDVSTRWNSTLAMISRLLRNKDAVRATLDLHRQQRSTPAMVTNGELEKMEKLEALLEPCR